MKKGIYLAFIVILCFFVLTPTPTLFTGSYTPKIIKKTLNGTIHLQLPLSFQISENLFGDRKQLLYSAFMNDEEQLIRGYIEVWQLEDVEKFLVNSKDLSSYDFYSYSLNKITIGNLSGLLNAWGASFGEHSKISGKEYWLKKPESTEVLRIAFLTSNADFSPEQLKLINNILLSLLWE